MLVLSALSGPHILAEADAEVTVHVAQGDDLLSVAPFDVGFNVQHALLDLARRVAFRTASGLRLVAKFIGGVLNPIEQRNLALNLLDTCFAFYNVICSLAGDGLCRVERRRVGNPVFGSPDRNQVQLQKLAAPDSICIYVQIETL